MNKSFFCYIFLVFLHYIQNGGVFKVYGDDTFQIQNSSLKIVGGKPIEEGRIKFMASVRLKEELKWFGKGHHCGGSLISIKTVLTAAHCLYLEPNYVKISPSELFVVLGHPNLAVRTKLKSTQVIDVEKVTSHTGFTRNPLANDVAVLHLTESVSGDATYVDYITMNNRPDIRPPGRDCKIMGWGKTNKTVSEYTDMLTVADVEILVQKFCEEKYKDTYKVAPGMFCAGSLDKRIGSCFSDSGGPLTCGNILFGVGAGASTCGHPNRPGIYLNVGYYHNWIRKTISYTNNIIPLGGHYCKALLMLSIFEIKL